MGPPGFMRLQFPFLCRVRNRLAPRESPRWRPRLGRGARGLPIAAASLALLIGAGSAGFATSATHTYVVRPGDSLWAISQANGLTVQQLAAANGMNLNDMLLIGRHLVIPSNQPAAPSAAPASATGGSSAAAGSSSTENVSTFCSTLGSSGGPWGVLPWLLQESPGRLALRPLFVEWASHYDLSLSATGGHRLAGVRLATGRGVVRGCGRNRSDHARDGQLHQ